MNQIKGRKGSIYLIQKQFPYLNSTIKLERALIEVSISEIENKPEGKFLIKKLSVPTRLQPDHLKFIREFNKLCTSRSDSSLLKLVDFEEKDNMIYLIQEYKKISPLTLDDQIKEVNIVNIIREIVRIYSDLPNVILQALGNEELCFNPLHVSNILYNHEDYSVMLDILNYGIIPDEKIYAKPDEGCIHLRNLGELIIQLLYKKSKGTEKLNDFFEKQASLENGVQITEVMKNLIRALFSKNPPTWEKLSTHPLLNPLEGDYETWKNDYLEFTRESKGDLEEKYKQIKRYLMALDDLNDERVILMASNVMESAVRLLLFLILNSILKMEAFLDLLNQGEMEKKKKEYSIQIKELKNYYGKALKKDFDEGLKTSNEWFLKLKEIDFFDLPFTVENQNEWISKLQGELQEDVEKVFGFLKEKGVMLKTEKNFYLNLIKK